MDNYKKQIRELRNELHNNKKELKTLDNKYDKADKYRKISFIVMVFGMFIALVLCTIGFAISYAISNDIFVPILSGFALCGSISGLISSFIYTHLEKKVNIYDGKYCNLEDNIEKLKEEIKNTHYFNLEKQRNKVIEENGVNTLETTQKQIDLLNEYKSRINGIYDNQIPKEVDKEIKYLNNKVKKLKLGE